MRSPRLLFLVAAALLSTASIAFAEKTGVMRRIEHQLGLRSAPQRGVFIIGCASARPFLSEGVLVPLVQPSAVAAEDDSQEHSWIAGAKFFAQADEPISYALIVAFKDGGYAAVPCAAYTPPRGEEEDNRKLILQRRGDLQQVRGDLDRDRKVIERLRSDAEVIGNFGRIFEAKRELGELTAERESLERYSQILTALLGSGPALNAPQNLPRREGQLTQQIVELVQAGRKVEDLRSSGRIGELMDPVNHASDPNDGLEPLRAKLQELRAERARLEHQGAGAPLAGDPMQEHSDDD